MERPERQEPQGKQGTTQAVILDPDPKSNKYNSCEGGVI
jgi:hypothetical protein